MNSAGISRRSHQRRQERRRRTLERWLLGSFMLAEVAVGGATGLLFGAIILNAICPRHPFYVAIREWLCSALGLPKPP